MPGNPYSRPRGTNLTPAAWNYEPRITPTEESWWDWTRNKLDEWKFPLLGGEEGVGTGLEGMGRAVKEAMTDPEGLAFNFMNPMVTPAAVIVPKALQMARIDRLVNQMKAGIPNLKDIPRGEKFVSTMERWMKELHPEIASHINEAELFSEGQVRGGAPKNWRGSYSSGITNRRKWDVLDPDQRIYALQEAKDRAARAREAGIEIPGYTTPESFDPILDNKLTMAEHSDWGNPEKMLRNPRHELAHAAQDLGFTKKLNDLVLEGSRKKVGSTGKEWYPVQSHEIGANVAGAKAADDYARLMGGERKIRPARDIWADQFRVAANRSNVASSNKGRILQNFRPLSKLARNINDANRNLGFDEPIKYKMYEPSTRRNYINPDSSMDWGFPNKNRDWTDYNKYSLFIDEELPKIVDTEPDDLFRDIFGGNFNWKP